MYDGPRSSHSSSNSSSRPRPSSSASNQPSSAQNSPKNKLTQPNEQAKRNRDRAHERRQKTLPPDTHRKMFPEAVEFGTVSPTSDVSFTREVRAGLNSAGLNTLNTLSNLDNLDKFCEHNHARLGVHWNAVDAARHRRSRSTQQHTSSASSSTISSSSSEDDLLNRMFNSVKHLTALRLSPLPKLAPPAPAAPPSQQRAAPAPVAPTAPPPTKHRKSKQPSSPIEVVVPNRFRKLSQKQNVSLSPDNSSTKTHKPTKPTPDVSDNLIQNPQIHSTVQPSSKLWVTAPLSRLKIIHGLAPTLCKRLHRHQHHQHHHHQADPYHPTPAKVQRESPVPFVDSTIVDSPASVATTTKTSTTTTPPRRTRTPTKFRTPTKRVKTGKESGYTVSPIKPGQLPRSPDSTVQQPHALQPSRSPDSSSVIPVSQDYKEYYRNGRDLRERGIEQEGIESYLSAFVTFTEAIYHFNMSVYLLVCELDKIVAAREKNSHNRGRQMALQIEEIISRNNMPLCLRIRDSEYVKSKHRLSEAEQHILDQLMIMCLRCEAKLHMIMHKAQTSHQDHFTQMQNNKELIKRVDENYEQQHSVRLGKDEWKQIKFAMKHQSYLQKAHIAWGQSERMCRKGAKIHDDFFNSIQVIADVPELTFYESSLKDLASYQRAIVNKLRDEIPTM